MASSSNASARSNNQPQPHPFDPSPPNSFAEAAWRYVSSQLTTDVLAAGTPQAHLPLSDIFLHMPPSDQQWVLSAFQNFVNCPSQWSLLPENDLAVCHLVNYGPQEGQKIDYVSPSDKMVGRSAFKKVPRPLNSFILYRKDRQEIVKQQHPGLCNNDISKILGQQWRGESKEIRAFYKSKADEAKLAHVTQYPDYQYRPRRPEEKKRRMTKNKKRKLEQRLQAEQIAVSTINNQIDPFLLDGCDMGYIGSTHSEGHSTMGDAPIHLESSDFDFDSATRSAAEREMEFFPWDDLTDLVNLGHSLEPYDGDYMGQTGIIPGVYLLSLL